MNTCHWCGDRHGADQLCQRAKRGMTRRSFCFLFGAGIAGLALPAPPDPVVVFDGVPVSQALSDLSQVVGRQIYRTRAGGTEFKLIATITDNVTRTWTDNVSGLTFDNLPIFGAAEGR